METEFKAEIREAAKAFSGIEKKEVIKLITHTDSDGISAAAILVKMLTREGRKFSLTFVRNLTEKLIQLYAHESFKYFIFADIGSSQYKHIRKYMKEKIVFILDHHETKIRKEDANIYHLNPMVYGLDGCGEISGAGVAYLFAKALDNKNTDLAYLALIGAIGDSQENDGFKGINNKIEDDAITSKKVRVEEGIKCIGKDTRPLYKIIKDCVNFYIPSVTGNDDKAVEFLASIGIEPKEKGRWRRVDDLNEEEKKKLFEAIEERKDKKAPASLTGKIYIIQKMEKEFGDIRELSTVLNACGKLDKAHEGLGILLGDKKSILKADYTLKEYKSKIMQAIKWYENNKKTKKIISDKGFLIINGEDNIPFNIIGTLTSIFSRNKMFPQGTFILAMSRTIDNKVKVSVRITGNIKKTNLLRILNTIMEKFEGECGGHSNAAGGIIEISQEKDFIEFARSVLAKEAIEEVVE